MESVRGLGGIFLRAKDQPALAKWYRDHLGLPIQDAWWGASLPLTTPHDTPAACVVWSAFPQDTTYFGRRENAVMVNFRVRDLAAMRAQLIAAGCDVDPSMQDGDYGKFGWVTDPEGNRIELWQPRRASRVPSRPAPDLLSRGTRLRRTPCPPCCAASPLSRS
jgi:predicted enzyme related to lactoylglutathione lyase